MERFETKYDLLNRVYADTRLKRTSKALMQYLVIKSDERSCHPSVASIAASIRMSERTVQRHMRELEKYHYIACKSRFYRDEQLTNQYEFVLDVIDDGQQIENEKIGSIIEKVQAEAFCKGNTNFSKMKYIKNITKMRLSNKEHMLLIYLVHKANQSGIVYGSIIRICKELHMSQRLLWKIILELREQGYFMLKQHRGRIAVKLVYREKVEVDTDMEKEMAIYPESKKVYQEKSFEKDHTIKTDDNSRNEKNVKQKIKIGDIIRWFWDKLYQRFMHFLL